MTDITQAIDSWTQTRYQGYYTLKTFGFCELMSKTSGGKDGTSTGEETFPVTIPDRTKVSIDDKFSIITWQRWIAPAQFEVSEEWSYGATEARVGTLPIRLVLAHKASLGEDICFDFINNFPSKFSVSGYNFVFVNTNLSVDPDHEAIIKTEVNATNYEKHRFTWNLYLITINVQFWKCEQLTP